MDGQNSERDENSGRLTWLSDALFRVRRFSGLLFYRFSRDDALQNAASLTYTTLLSLVPLMAVSLALFAAFPIGDRVAKEIQDFIFSNFVPTSGEVIRDYLEQFSHKASRMTGAGSVFLVLVALMMMANIDRAFNTIWHVRRKRSPLSTFLMYWSILSLGPILIAISVALTSYLVSLPLFAGAAETLELGGFRFLGLLPVLISSLAFMLMYLIVPNRYVPISHAFMGGLLAGFLFEIAKHGFAFFVTFFPAYEAIYGALAIVPIFLVWVYLSWLVTLLGAEFTYCLGIYHDDWQKGGLSPGKKLMLAYRLLGHLWQSQQRGMAMSLKRLVDAEPHTSEEGVEHVLHQLQSGQLVLRTDKGRWALARNLSKVSLYDLFRAGDFVLPRKEHVLEDSSKNDKAMRELLGRIDADLQNAMTLSLEELYKERKPARMVVV